MKKISEWLLALTLVFALTACGAATAPPAAGEDTPQAESTTPETAPEPGSTGEYTGELSVCYALLGKTEAEVDAVLEGGEKNLSEDGATLLGASYTMTLLGESALVELIYGDDGRVVGVSIGLPEEQYDAARADLEGDFGAPKELDDTQDLGTAYLEWTLNHASLALSQNYGSTQIQMSLSA